MAEIEGQEHQLEKDEGQEKGQEAGRRQQGSRLSYLENIWPADILTDEGKCLTMCYMKTATLTIRLDKELQELLAKASRRTGKNRSAIVREALLRQIRLETFGELRKRIMPFAEARGYLTDEDIFSKL